VIEPTLEAHLTGTCMKKMPNCPICQGHWKITIKESKIKLVKGDVVCRFVLHLDLMEQEPLEPKKE